MSLINIEISLMLTWLNKLLCYSLTGAGTILITDAKCYVPLMSHLISHISTHDNAESLKQLYPGSKLVAGINISQNIKTSLKPLSRLFG